MSDKDYEEAYLAESPGYRPSFALETSGWHPAVLLTTILCAWLHLAGHLSFRFCDAVLVTIGYIFCEFGQRSLAQDLPSSLRGALSRLRLENIIHILPVCPKCSLVCSEKTYDDRDAKCESCKTSIFTFAGLPHLRFPYLSLEEQLRSILMVQGMEDLLHHWTTVARMDGRLRDIFDGKICSKLCGPDGRPFFRVDLAQDPFGEIRVGLALGLDW